MKHASLPAEVLSERKKDSEAKSEKKSVFDSF